MTYHVPVLLQEVLEGLNVRPGKRYIDATFGGGGHTKAMLDMGAEVLAIDTDADAVREAAHITNKNFHIHQGNFRDIEEIAQSERWDRIDGILFDLGVSSHQLDEGSRGFSYKFADAPFDLRLNQNEGVPASTLVNHETETELADIIGRYGEEESCGHIAYALVHSRVKKPIETTGDVLKIVEEAVGEHEKYETASRVFQAFRIVVNDELGSLKKGLLGASRLIMPGGRLAVISFHSLEDRIVKQFFQTSGFTILTKKPIRPSDVEQHHNKRSRSAKLRIGEKI